MWGKTLPSLLLSLVDVGWWWEAVAATSLWLLFRREPLLRFRGPEAALSPHWHCWRMGALSAAEPMAL